MGQRHGDLDRGRTRLTGDAGRRYEVSREAIRAFAEAIGDDDPAYTDPEHARRLGHRDVLAPPTFVVTVAARLSGSRPVPDGVLEVDWARVVHGEQEIEARRPLHPGDCLAVATRVAEDVRKGAHRYVVLESTVTDQDDEVVAVLRLTMVERG